MNLPFGDNPYKTLGINRDATEAEIKHAYFNRVREHPPERDPEGFKRIRAAYEKLSAATRTETDLFLIDDQSATVNASSIQLSETEPPPVTLQMVQSDLLALESIFLIEELKSWS